MINDRKLIYTRLQKDLDLNPEREVTFTSLESTQEAQVVVDRNLIGYEKNDGVLSCSIVCVISGGERREKDFLREVIRCDNIQSLRVAFLSKEGQGLQPYQMKEKWLEILRTGNFEISGQKFQIDAIDKIFLLSDVDEFYEQLVNIIGENSDNDSPQWIISNPCFEVWLYYCFKNNPTVDLNSIEPLTFDKRSQEMKRLGNIIVPGGLNPIIAFENMKEGIIHSRSYYAEDNKYIPMLYSTQMYRMAEFLIEVMNRNAKEYDQFIAEKREWRNIMRNKRTIE